MANYKVTTEQIKSMQKCLSDISANGKKENSKLKFYYNALTPKYIYFSYVYYSLNNDNSINSTLMLMKIAPDGKVENMRDNADNYNTVLQLFNDFIEIDLDANGKIVFV